MSEIRGHGRTSASASSVVGRSEDNDFKGTNTFLSDGTLLNTHYKPIGKAKAEAE